MKSTKNILKNGITLIVGDGNKIKFWTDNWLHSRPLRAQIQGPLQMDEQNRKISDCI